MAKRKLLKKRNRDWWPVIGVLALMLLWFMLFRVGPTVAANVQNFDQQNSWEEITVKKGDTLWRIAQQYQQPREDVRTTIRRIQAINQLSPSEPIYPGQTLLVPIK